MIDLAIIYRDQMVRGVLGTRPAALASEANTTLLGNLAQRLVDAEQSLKHLRALGYGQAGQTLAEIVQTLPPAPKR